MLRLWQSPVPQCMPAYNRARVAASRRRFLTQTAELQVREVKPDHQFEKFEKVPPSLKRHSGFGKSLFWGSLLVAGLWWTTVVGTCVLADRTVQAMPAQSSGAGNASGSRTSPAATSGLAASRLTKNRLEDSGWWPTKRDRSRDEYVGASICAECHDSKVNTARKTAMARAATRASESESLQQVPLAMEIGAYRYQISDSDGKKVLKVSGGRSSRSADLLWAFGMGRIAQTYVYQQNGRFYESHVSFYTSIQALDVTPGHPRTAPANAAEGLGRLMPVEETFRCFGCHTTASTTNNRLDTQKLFPGVSCESCHGPGARHVAAMKAGDYKLALSSIMNPAHLSARDSVEFCGACHRTWQDVVSDGPTRSGTLNVRFQPYRLENSRCWKEGNARITCIGCHDPHQPLEHDPVSYDAKCLQCHRAASVSKSDGDHDGHVEEHAAEDQRAACTVGVKLCVTCHMPKFTNPVLHGTFTDHWIRIAPNGAPLPN